MHPEFVEFTEDSRCICEGREHHIHILARKMLELKKDQAAKLFHANPPGDVLYDQFGEYTSITKETAARVLRHLAKTGQVEWEGEDK